MSTETIDISQGVISHKVYFDVNITKPGGAAVKEGRITMGLFGNDVPKTCANFKQLVA